MRTPMPLEDSTLVPAHVNLPFAQRTLPPRLTAAGEPDTRIGLTTDIARKILVALANGVYRETAARYAGVDATRLSRWMHTKGDPFETFQSWVTEAEAYAEIRAINAITAKMADRPELAVTFLERKYPERWAKVVALPPGNVNVNLNLTTMLQQIEQRALSARDPRGPLPGARTIIDVMNEGAPVRREPIPLEPHESEGGDGVAD